MAAQVRTKIDLSDLDTRRRPALRLVPPLEQQQPPRSTVKRRPARHRAPALGTRRVATCVPTARHPHARLPLFFLLGLVAFVGVIAIGLLAGSMAGSGVPERTAVVWVQPGDTLWDVAERAAPGYDTEAVVARIRELNEVPVNGILAGQALEVPSAP
jgi:hypothetical protein